MVFDLPDDILVEVFSYLTVEDIVLRIRHVNERWVAVADNCGIWRRLTYKPTLRYKEEEIVDFLKQAPKLQWFMPPCGYTTTNLFIALMKYCKDIRNLELNMAEADCKLLQKFVSACPKVETVNVIDDNFGGSRCLRLVSQFPNLKTLRLNDDFYLPKIVERYEYILTDLTLGCPNLQCLDLRCLKRYTCHDLEYFLEKKKHNIVTLLLNCTCRESKCPLTVIGCCTNLQALCVENGCFLPCPLDALAALKNIPNMKTLSMPRFRYNDVTFLADYFETGPVQSLVKLDLSGCKHFGTRLLWAICDKCPSLKQLNVKECADINDESLKKVSQLTQLEYLNIACCNEITDRGVAHLVECRRLKYLNLNECKRLTNESFNLCYVYLKMLQELHMNSCDIDPKAFLEIPRHLKNLRVLNILLPKFGRSTIHVFKLHMPHVDLRCWFESQWGHWESDLMAGYSDWWCPTTRM